MYGRKCVETVCIGRRRLMDWLQSYLMLVSRLVRGASSGPVMDMQYPSNCKPSIPQLVNEIKMSEMVFIQIH